MEIDSNRPIDCLEVQGNRDDPEVAIQQLVTSRPQDPATGDDDTVLVQIQYSSVNYKDALAATGHPGVARSLPLVPGIDAVGIIAQSTIHEWPEGQRVIINDEAFGTSQDGGWRQTARVPTAWLVRCPESLDNYQIACLGTAGITAAWCVDALQRNGSLESDLPIVVTGATGGVGSIAMEMLHSLGCQVAAVSGKSSAVPWLEERGAAEVLDRKTFCDESKRPLLSARFGGGVDTVGSVTLATVLRSVADGGCVSACGMAGGPDLPITVYPFILRGVILYGVDCTRYSGQEKEHMWTQLGQSWLPTKAIQDARTVSLSGVMEVVHDLLNGRNTGRVVVDLQN